MPIRIYAFAKELGIDNKQLLDICEKAGIKGKGSALASLDDDEVVKVKDIFNNKDAPKTETKAPVAAVSKPRIEAPIAPERRSVLPTRSGPIRDLNQPAKRTSEKSGEAREHKKEPKKTPIAKLAAVPDVEQPSATTSDPKEKVQKPDIALPQDAIRKVKSGAAPLGQFTKTTKEKEKDRKKKPKSPKSPGGISMNPPEILGEMPRKKDHKRGKKTEEPVPGLGSTRQSREKAKRRRHVSAYETQRQFRRPRGRGRKSVVNTAAPRKENVALALPCSVRSFSEAAGVGAGQVIKALMDLEIDATINAQLDDEIAVMLAEQLEVEIDFRQDESLEEKLIAKFEMDDDPDSLEPRPPVVTFLGHVDHGKTSLLDAIIGIDVVSGEAGGITQHIRAYEIEKNGNKIAFVDTPGHAAFTEMRARGANVTDIAVLVVAADDGVMPQTEEAISHAKAAKVPIIVAMNKIDLAGANPDKVYQDLAAHELLPSEWGGEIEVIKTSATKGDGIDELLETILVTAELHEYQANPHGPARGTCLEAEQESGRGVIAKVIVENGSLNVGDVVVCGASHGRVKAMYNTLKARRKLKIAGPSTPVNITGLDIAPEAGDKFYVMEDIAEARTIAASREHESRQLSLSGITTRVSLEDFQQRLESGNLKDETVDVVELNLILRADVRGSIEAIQKEFEKLDHPEIRINILQALVGGITTADVRLAQASQAVIIGFNVVPDDSARSLADEVQVEIRRYEVIYKITEDIKATLEGRLKPDEQIVEVGMAMVLRTFTVSRTGTIAGCRVMRGTIHRDCRLRVIRESRVIGDYPIDSLRREKDDAKEVQRGMECGIKLAGFNDIKEGDQLEAYKVEEVARTL